MRLSILKREDACVYCGDGPRCTRDHFRPVIGQTGLPTGYCNDQWNIVPACPTCNASKGNRPWLVFMSTPSPTSPLGRGVLDVPTRIAALQRFELLGRPQLWPAQRYHAELRALKDMTRVRAQQRVSAQKANVSK